MPPNQKRIVSVVILVAMVIARWLIADTPKTSRKMTEQQFSQTLDDTSSRQTFDTLGLNDSGNDQVGSWKIARIPGNIRCTTHAHVGFYGNFHREKDVTEPTQLGINIAFFHSSVMSKADDYSTDDVFTVELTVPANAEIEANTAIGQFQVSKNDNQSTQRQISRGQLATLLSHPVQISYEGQILPEITADTPAVIAAFEKCESRFRTAWEEYRKYQHLRYLKYLGDKDRNR